MIKENSIDLFKRFLEEMFQFNANDEHVGIYRIYNPIRKEIENFIDGKVEQMEMGKTLLGLSVINADIFNQ